MSPSAIVRTSKNTMMLAGGTGARMVAAFAFALYCAALLGVEGFGKYSIAIFYFELSLSLASTAAGILLTRDLAKRPEDISKLMTAAVVLSTVLCCLAPLVVLPLGFALRYSADTLQAMGIGCCALFPAALCVILEAVFVTKERAEFVTAGTALESIFRIGLCFAVLILGYGFVELMWVLVLTRMVLLVGYLVSLKRIVSFGWNFSANAVQSFASRWRVFAAENWMATIYTSLDVLILSYISGEAAVGLYSAAWKLVRLGSVLAKSYTTAIFPVMSRLYGTSQAQFRLLYRQSIRAMSMVAVPVAVVVGVLADRIVQLLFTEEYAASAAIVRVLIWVLLAEFLNPFLSHALFAQGKQRKSMNVAMISLLFNLGATYVLVRQYGAVGAAAGTVFSGLVATCCYIAYLVPRGDIAAIAASNLRILVASLCVGVIPFYFRDLSWPLLLGVCVAAYLPLLFLVRGVRLRDFASLKSALSHRGQDREARKVRVGVIGCGAIAECYHLPALRANLQTRDGIVLVDSNRERVNQLADEFSAADVATDFTQVVDRVDAVIVATPPASHYEIAKWFLERGIHVLCEKPLTESIAEAEDLVTCGLANDAFLFVNQTRRFFPAYQVIRGLLADGELGELQSIEYQDGIEFDWPAASPHHFRPDARGAWSDTGVHLLDTIIYWLGAQPELVGAWHDGEGGPEAMATVQLRHANCEVTLKVSRLGRLPNRFQIVGSLGAIESDAENWSEVVISFHNGKRRRIRCDAEQFQGYNDFAAPLIQNLVDSVCGEGVPVVSGESVLPTVRLLEAAYDEAQRYDMPWNEHWRQMSHVS